MLIIWVRELGADSVKITLNKALVLSQHSMGLMCYVPSVETSLALKHQPVLMNVSFVFGRQGVYKHPALPLPYFADWQFELQFLYKMWTLSDTWEVRRLVSQNCYRTGSLKLAVCNETCQEWLIHITLHWVDLTKHDKYFRLKTKFIVKVYVQKCLTVNFAIYINKHLNRVSFLNHLLEWEITFYIDLKPCPIFRRHWRACAMQNQGGAKKKKKFASLTT